MVWVQIQVNYSGTRWTPDVMVGVLYLLYELAA